MSWSDEVHTSSLNVWFYVAVIASFGLLVKVNVTLFWHQSNYRENGFD